jgi:type I restriction enzyme M protein
MTSEANIVNKLWGFCHILRHDGMDYGDYVEQLTYLLFLKMANEKNVDIPEEYSWKVLMSKSGVELTDFYSNLLRDLSKRPGLLGAIFAEALSKFTKPVNLKKLIDLIDEIDWSGTKLDIKAHAYEGLLERSASEGKKGAGQYFTPRVLIQTIIKCMKPDPRTLEDFTISDPAAGTGGFLVEAFEWLVNETGGAFNRDDLEHIKKNTYFGTELVARPRRLALMNLYLHGIESDIKLGDSIYEPDDGKRFNVVLTNPPFGTRGANQAPERQDFTVSTSSKQLNFIQHILTILKPGGRAAIVVPDSVLFEDKAGLVFKFLMNDCNLHTILRLPRGTFTPYAQGVQANVIFFQKGLPTSNVWIYDGKTNVEVVTKKDRPLNEKHFEDFISLYGDDPNGNSSRVDQGVKGRFRNFNIEEIKARNYNLNISWLKESDGLDIVSDQHTDDLIQDAIKELQSIINDLNSISKQV